jgi:phosphodiesterase/alkaline phosphatase D-like protein
MRFLFALAVAFQACVSASNAPAQVHISLAGSDSDNNSNTIAVSWATVTQTSTSVVKYGVKSGVYSDSSTGYSRSYYETFHNHVVLKTLSPDTVYYYIVGDDVGGWSSELTFTSAPLSANLRGNFSFAVFGDLGVVNGDPTNKYLIAQKDNLKFVVHSGDIGYADDSFLHSGCYTKFCYEDTYDTYMSNIQPWASKLPYMVAPGNHEAG